MKKILLLALIPCLPALFIAQIPTAGLIAYYPFSGNANDQGPNAMNGTVNGATLTTDRFCNANSAYAFNGTSAYISLPTTGIVGLNNYSYSTWIKPLGYTGPSGGMPWCSGENGPYCQGLTYQPAGTLFGGSYNIGSNPVQSYSQSGSMPLGNWIHVVVTRDPGAIKLYVNGVLTGLASGSNNNNQSADYGSSTPLRVFLGARTNLTAYFNGLIDDVRIYNTTLTQSDVTALYNEAPSFQPAPYTSYSVCIGTPVSFTATSPGNTTSWYLQGSTAIATGNVYSPPSYTSAGTYIYYATPVNCGVIPTEFTLTVHPLPSVSATFPSTLVCAGEKVIFTASGAASYSWSNGITTNTMAVIAQPSDIYTVTGTDNNGCSNSFTVSQRAVVCEGIPENNTSSQRVSIFPNPNTGNFTIKYGPTPAAVISFIIQDVQGRAVKELMLDPTSGPMEVKDESLLSGLYFWKLIENNRIISAGKLIIN